MDNTKFYMITDQQIEQIADLLLEKVIAAGNDPLMGVRTCSKTAAAERLGVNRATVYNMIADGRLRSTADGKKVLVESLVAYENGEAKRIDSIGNGRRGKKQYV